jgi:hypothetical protein
MDPLVETAIKTDNVDELEKSLPFVDWPISQLEDLGVMVDAGRSFFPIPWLKRRIVRLQKKNYNLLRLRLSDDERFMVEFGLYP